MASTLPPPTTTLAIVPNERWSLSVPSLRAVLGEAPNGVELVYVDGGSPAAIEAELRSIVADHGGTYLRRDHVLVPNEARNLALAASDGELIVFADNDVVPEPGWFEALVSCAVETGAGAVCALITHGTEGGSRTVHHIDGDFRIEDGRVVANLHGNYDEDLDALGPLERVVTNQIEFHSMLVRRRFLDEIGGFDEHLRSMGDHEDLALQAERHGWEIWFEPDAVVTFLQFAPLERDDWGLWQQRWSEEWNESSLAHFAEKWELRRDVDWVQHARWWSSQQRMQWWRGHGTAADLTGKVFRRASGGPSRRAALARHLEERVFCRAGRVEARRREAALAAR